MVTITTVVDDYPDSWSQFQADYLPVVLATGIRITDHGRSNAGGIDRLTICP
jgi:hypothetical protein